jgi:hypothetical protein
MNSYPRKKPALFSWWLVGGVGLVAMAVAVLVWMPDSQQFRNRRPGPSGGSAEAGAVAPAKSGGAAVDANAGGSTANRSGEHKADEFSLPALQKLVGRWRRRDADYVLKVESVDERGEVKAAYLNPNPIQIGKASAHSHGDAAHLTVELRDFNYPGCIYDLNLDPASGLLRGTYFQAALGETYDVEFARVE